VDVVAVLDDGALAAVGQAPYSDGAVGTGRCQPGASGVEGDREDPGAVRYGQDNPPVA